MGRFRVLSFISAGRGLSKNNNSSNNNAASPSPSSTPTPAASASAPSFFSRQRTSTASPSVDPASNGADSMLRKQDQSGSGSRPASAMLTQPPAANPGSDVIPELEPIFTFLSAQSNKLYQEGYFLKLNDLDTSGRPYQDRQWTDCFAQLIGTVLSLWDSAALDAAGPDAEVKPTFINLADASIKMIETLPTRNQGSRPLHNVLSVSTAGKNRYLLHFSSLHSLTQWTAAIRLAMFENTLLQESYTGALIAGKGKTLNSIRTILERTRFVYEDWARVRFGPGTPWKRCWCVISPPDEKEFQKMMKAQKKKSVYDRTAPLLQGNIKFYETKKTKKVKPIATITDAYSAFAIYPQSRPLIDQSTLVKVEGKVTIHTQQESTAEGFVFVLPEVHPGVSGFEMMLRWLFPVFDTYGLYGRPTRLIADTVSTRSLMFALPKHKRSGYLDILDVTALIHTEGSNTWGEREWRKALKEATAKRMSTNGNSRESSVTGSGRLNRSSLPSRSGTSLRFATDASNSGPTGRPEYNRSSDAIYSMTSKPGPGGPSGNGSSYDRPVRTNSNGTPGYRNYRGQATPPSRSSLERGLPEEDEQTHEPPARNNFQYDGARPIYRRSSKSDHDPYMTQEHQAIKNAFQQNPAPAPVAAPPAFRHDPRSLPAVRPQPSPELHKAGNRLSYGTLSQLVDINSAKGMAAAGASAAWNDKKPESNDQGQRGIGESDGNADSGPTNTNFASESPSPITPDTPKPYLQTAPHTTIDNSPSSRPTSLDQQPAVSPINNRKSLTRKPVPYRTYDAESHSSDRTSSLGSLRNAIDVDALDRVMARGRSPSPPLPNIQDEESVYDQSSVASPDYASSHKSSVSRRSEKSVYRPRMGVKKVVGTEEPKVSEVVIGDARYQPTAPSQPANPDIPVVDFGPTHALNPTTRRPSSSDTLTLLTHNRMPSDATIGQNERKGSPGKTNHANGSDPHLPKTPSSDERRRSMIWQPGIVSGRASPGPRITPEQFVQQRVEANRVPSHQRVQSGTTPPPRPASGDWTNYARQQSMMQDMPARPHSRGASIMLGQSGTTPPSRPSSGDWTNTARMMREMPPRPNSRGASTMLGQNDISSHLSAREQEHLARVTGSSFFNMSSETHNQPPPVVGSSLVSAIDAREREKKAMKEGVSGQMVQQAIAQRQYQTQMQSPPPQYQSQYPNPSQSQTHFIPHHQHTGSSGYFPPPQQQQQQPQHRHQQSRSSIHQGRQQQPQPQQISPPSTTGYRPNPYYQPPLR
ncbi:hypothetical protein FQN50_003874 [Emmonsiellopsis sp. PD_5]|nr:hypothetical protein FQN50_003874 [Emmonsiellopsis sp. PD_5]